MQRAGSALFRLDNLAATHRLGAAIGKRLRAGDLVTLAGDLGAGKTELVRGIAAGMNLATQVSSPTFALIHEHSGPITLIHVDAYRLSAGGDLSDAGLDDYLRGQNVVVVEWPDRIEEVLPAERLAMELAEPASAGNAARVLTAQAAGERYAALLAEILRELNDLAGM